MAISQTETMRLWLIVLVLTMSIFSTVTAQEGSSNSTNQNNDGNFTCTGSFSNDLYGLGVRMGYYFNWVSGWIANNFVPSEIAGAQDNNSIFLLGLLASLFRGTATGRLTRIDGLVLLELAAGTTWSVLSLWGYRTCIYKRENLHGMSNFGGFGTHFRLLLLTMLASYGVWFFLMGVDPHGAHRLSLYKEAPDIDRCKNVVLLGLPLSGGVRIAGIIFSIASLVYCGAMLASSSLAGVTRSWKMAYLIRHGRYSSSSRLRYIPGLNQQQLIQLWQVLRLFNIFWIIFAMIVIELTLNENHVRAVLARRDADFLTPSQLLPLLIGMFSFGRTLYYAYEYFRAGDGEIRPSLGFDSSTHSGVPLPRPTGIRSTLLWWMRCLSNSLHEPSKPTGVKKDKENNDIDFVIDHWTTGQRLLIVCFPWMSALSFWPWRNDTRSRRIEGFEGDSNSNEPLDGTVTNGQKA